MFRFYVHKAQGTGSLPGVEFNKYTYLRIFWLSILNSPCQSMLRYGDRLCQKVLLFLDSLHFCGTLSPRIQYVPCCDQNVTEALFLDVSMECYDPQTGV